MFWKKENKLPDRFTERKHSKEYFLDRMKREDKNVTPKEFKKTLNQEFVPYLRELGFKGSSKKFSKNLTLELNITFELSTVPGQYHLMRFSYGVELSFFKEAKINPLFDNQLVLPNGNYDFDLGQTIEENLETIKYIEEAFKEQVGPFIQQFNDFPKVINSITISDITNFKGEFKELFGKRHEVFGNPDPIEYATQFARIFSYYDNDKLHEFTDFVLQEMEKDKHYDDDDVHLSRISRLKEGDKNFYWSKSELEEMEEKRKDQDELLKKILGD
jgi:hypothetical protein